MAADESRRHPLTPSRTLTGELVQGLTEEITSGRFVPNEQLLKLAGLTRLQAPVLPEFYQQNSRRLRDQFGREFYEEEVTGLWQR